ncbi:MAG: hpnC [Ilumatobacteraceae bacterium]|nr:hpnC [Ilumatobacteraceae bacterium]
MQVSVDSWAQTGLPRDLPVIDSLQRRIAAENFPVALRVLPRDVRADLFAVYGFARFTDEIGDSYVGDRLVALDWLERELDAAAVGCARHPLVAGLTPVIERRGTDLALFRDLIEANRRDQRQRRYATSDDLLDYCRQSAHPVGRLVLAIFGVSDPAVLAPSDDVCGGLQIVEHLQDLGEDLAAGRIYLPAEDMDAFGCTEADLGRATANPATRRLIAYEAGRARTLLGSARALTDRLGGRARVAVAGFAAGGLAALDAIESCGFDTLGHHCRPTPRRLVVHMTALLAPRRRTGRVTIDRRGSSR